MKKWFLFLFVLGVVGILGFAVGVFVASSGWRPDGNLAVVEIEGPIFDAGRVLSRLDDYAENEQVRALVLRIESPGGAVGAAQEIYEAVLKVRQTKTVVASIGSVGASGGYYIAAAAQKIFANPGAITGSIGVLMEHVNVERFMEWARLKPQILKSGRLKDMGSPIRPMTPEETELFHELLGKLHLQFQKAVSEQRNLPMDQVQRLSDGRVFTGEEAVGLGLIDRIGGLGPAIDEAAKMAGIEGRPDVIYPERNRRGLLDILFGAATVLKSWVQMSVSGGWVPLYLWKGSF